VKATLSFKTPDVFDHATEGMTQHEAAKFKSVARKWVTYDEYIYIEIDSDAGTATVLER